MRLAPFLIVITVISTAQAQVQTPGPQDVPQPVPGDVGLAGSSQPDIARYLNVRVASAPSLSPDGRWLSYLTGTTGQPQLWVVRGLACPSMGCAPRQLTFGEQSVTFHEYSPVGDWIIYGTDRAGDEREGFYLITSDGLSERELLPPSNAYRVFGGWSPDGRRIAFASTERNGVDFDIYVMDIKQDGTPSAPRRVYEGKAGIYVASWRPDGGALLLTETRGEADNNVYLLDLANGNVETIFKPEDAAAYGPFAWTPDSRGFYVVTNQGRDLASLAHYDVATKRLRWFVESRHEIEGLAMTPDGRWIAWTTNENGYSRVVVRNMAAPGAAPRYATMTPALPRGIYSIAFAKRAPVLSIRIGGPRVPGDVWLWDARTGATSRATESATGGLDASSFVEPEALSFKSFDGETVYGLLYLPRNIRSGTKPPVLLGVHGGPTSQARPAYSSSFQYLLSRGIAVFDLNFRGSTGYGKRFTRLDNQRLRPNAVKDMAAALDFLQSTGRVDATRASVMGGSYGGYMTFAAVTQLPDRFKSGVGFVGVSNWVTALEGASPQLKASDRIEYGNIDDPEDRKFFTELSPITHVKNVRAPLMVLHGANDPRDPVTEADQLVRAIRQQGGEVEYLRFPDEGHGIRKLTNRITAYRRIATFLHRTLAVEPAVP
jgi:dipeptidyl aminopeptidase/acylaminoacyl peptidase